MFIKYNTSPIQSRLIETGGEYFPLSEAADAFRGYDWVTVQIYWDSVDVFDGLVTMCERLQSRVPEWAPVPSQLQAINQASGSRIFGDYDLRAQEVSVHIDKGSATTGNFYWVAVASTQHNGEEIVTELKGVVTELKNVVTGLNELNKTLKKLLK